MQLLQTLVLDLRLKVQKELDRKKIEYLEAKCDLGIQKIRYSYFCFFKLIILCMCACVLILALMPQGRDACGAA